MKSILPILQATWWANKPYYLLIPFAWLFGLVARCRRCLYQRRILPSKKLPVTTIVIGNIVVGGVGKTPLTIAMFSLLRQMGKHPGIISRGYGGNYHGVAEVLADSDPYSCGDEPLLLKRRLQCPVFVCRQRALAGFALLEKYPECDVIICDDGLQHYALIPNITIAVFDNRGVGNGHLLPAGPLREPLEKLASVDAIVVNATEIPDLLNEFDTPVFQMQIAADEFRRVDNPKKTYPLNAFAGKTVAAIAGIGNPKRFFDTLFALHIDYISKSFDDHHHFRSEDIPKTDETVLMTEKDSVKCMAFSQPNWYFLAVSAKLPTTFTLWCAMKTGSLDCLVCPLCKGKLDYDPIEQTLTCQADRLVYPIKDGIPVMLVSEAVSLDDTTQST
jgi:tetraacyldisaccharide 4'-kinase